MGLIIKRYTKRVGRGRSGTVQVRAGFDHLGIFDIPRDAALHRHFILLLGKSAILQGAPLLKEFFEEEPAWREKRPRWCADALSSDKTKSPAK